MLVPRDWPEEHDVCDGQIENGDGSIDEDKLDSLVLLPNAHALWKHLIHFQSSSTLFLVLAQDVAFRKPLESDWDHLSVVGCRAGGAAVWIDVTDK